MTTSRPSRTTAALFLLSAGITAHQLALMQILSYVQWYHFAYMVVSLALLGFGASGTCFALWRRPLLAGSNEVIPLLMLGCGLTLPLATIPFTFAPLRFDLYLLFAEPPQFFRLGSVCLLYCLPFFFGGLAIALALTAGIERTGLLYSGNLTGSGAGGLLGLALSGLLLPEKLPGLIGLLPVAAGVLLLPRPLNFKFIGVAGLATSFCLLSFLNSPRLIPSQFKDISQALNLPGAKILAEIPSPHGLLQLISAPSLRQAPGLSLNYRGQVPNSAVMLVNGNAYSTLAGPSEIPVALLEQSPEFLGYLLSTPERVLLLQPGGSGPLGHALSQRARHITVVEPHPLVHYFMMHGVGPFGGYGRQPGLQFIREEPRTFLAARSRPYDLIRFPPVGALSANIGIFALNEQYLLTVEAFAQALQSLDSDGVLMASAWLDYPLKNPLKMLATLIEAAELAGLDQPSHHIAAVRSWGLITFTITKQPISPRDADLIRARCAILGFDPLLLPDLDPTEREKYNLLNDPPFFTNIDLLFSRESRRDLYRKYDFNITPASDNLPYFSQFLRVSRLFSLAEILSLRQIPFFEMGSFILFATLLLLLSWAVFLIILPLFRLGLSGSLQARTLFYFGGLGLGYMMIEIVFIQRLTLFLGQPLLAAATVLSALLFAAGLGSLYSERLSPSPATIRMFAGQTCLLIIIYAFLLGGIGQFSALAGTAFRIIFAALVILPIGFIMGIPFPLGLRNLHGIRPDHLPWAWGINGCLSVIGPALATVIALQFGFRVVFGAAALAYFLALCNVQAKGHKPLD